MNLYSFSAIALHPHLFVLFDSLRSFKYILEVLFMKLHVIAFLLAGLFTTGAAFNPMPRAETEEPTEATEAESLAGNRMDSKITLTNLPDKLFYRIGESLDLTGATASTAIYFDGMWMCEDHETNLQKVAAADAASGEYSVRAPDMTTPGIKTVTFRYCPSYADMDEIRPSYASFAITVTDKGDVNGDGAADSADIRLVRGLLHGTAQLTEAARKNADLNEDGVVDVFDLSLMKRICTQDADNIA